MTARATSEGRQRRTQEQRSAETRQKLIDAALAGLLQEGYARITTADIAERAGVSRGALNHHFSGKEDLVVQAVHHQLDISTAEIRTLAVELSAGRLTFDRFLDELWAMFRGQLFLVTLEHVTEARHNLPLREKLIPVVKDFHAALDAIWREFFRASGLDEAQLETTLNATLCLLRGMGVQTVLRDDPAYYQRLLAWWKAELAAHMTRTDTRAGTVPATLRISR